MDTFDFKSGQMAKKSGQMKKSFLSKYAKLCQKGKCGQKKWANGQIFLQKWPAQTVDI